MDNFIFSIIISAYNSEKWIDNCIKSIIKQTLNFEKNIEIIIIDEGSKDNTKEICREYSLIYPNNIRFIPKNYEGKGISRNLGIKYAKGEYIEFLEGDDYLLKTTLKEVLNFFMKNEDIAFVSIPTVFLETKKIHPNFEKKYEKTRTINLMKHPEIIQFQSNACFFKKNMIQDIYYSRHFKLSEDITILNELLVENPILGVCCEGKYFKRKGRDNNAILNILPNSKDINTDEENYLKKLIQSCENKYGYIPGFIQNTLLYYFNLIILNENINEKLTASEITSVNKKIKYLLEYIDDTIIYNWEYMDVKIKTFLLYLKNEYSYPEKDQLKLTKSLKLDTVFIDIYEIINDELYILVNINSIDENEIVDVYINDEKIKTETLEFPQREKYYLNQKYLTNHTFEFKYKLKENENYTIKFKTKNQKLHVDFSRPCNFSRVVGYAKTRKFFSKLNNNTITISKTTTKKWIKQEIKTLFSMLKNKVPGFKTAIPIRIMYMILYPFLKNKRIWFYMDFPTIADDNGMHLFKYSMNQNEKDIKKYFIIDKNTPHYDKMKKIGPVIGYHSIKHRVLGLFTEKIITSHPDNNYIYAFWGHYPNFAGILKSSTIFLQHGITLNNICGWLNKYDKNLDFMTTASKKEYESLFKYHYNYDKDIIHLLGFPRFDNLQNEKTKTILLMPSWRRYLNHENKYTISNSSYFNTYNSLINNKKLIEKSEEYGYTIIFRPHPHVYKYVGLFDENESIKIDYERGSYQELFKKGALLITDYSSVAFDFAYLKKPVLYYQSTNDYHFNLDESYFDYETMGFGEVCRSEDELVDLIIEYMENDCKMKEKFIQNVEEYFTFTDKNNCMRVHNAINEIPPRD